jgi:hypothetical protein
MRLDVPAMPQFLQVAPLTIPSVTSFGRHLLLQKIRRIPQCARIRPGRDGFVYPERDWRRILESRRSDFAIRANRRGTGNDRRAIDEASTVLRIRRAILHQRQHTGCGWQAAVWRIACSGTNDKAGSMLDLLRWVSARTVKDTFNPAKDYRYPFMQAPD